MHNKTSAVTFRARCIEVRSCCCRLSYVNNLLFCWASHIKYEAFNSSEIQSQVRLISCLYKKFIRNSNFDLT